MYHIENSMIDQGTTMLLVNSIEKYYSLKLSDCFLFWTVIQCHFEIIISWPE